jgi:hypothetical protein
MMANSESINELASALIKAQAEFSVVPKDSVNPFFKSTYAALPDVMASVIPVLNRHGLGVSQFVSDDNTLTTYLLHESGQFISHTANLNLAKADPQGAGSAITYMRRYALMACLGVVADVDDDGNSASPSASQSYSAPSLSSKVASAASRPAGGGSKSSSEQQQKAIWAITHKALGWDDAQMFSTIEGLIGRSVNKLTELTMDDAKLVIEHIKALQEQQ